MVKLGNLSELSVGLVSISDRAVVMFMKIWEFLALRVGWKELL